MRPRKEIVVDALTLALLALLVAHGRRKPAWYLATGIAWGVAFTGHTAPAVLFGMVFLLLCAWDHAEAWRAGEHRGARIWGGFLLAAGVAFAVSLPYTASILWNYQFRVENPWPALFADPYLELSRWPDRLRDMVAWHNAVAAVGFGDAGDDGGKVRGGEPLRRAAAQDAVACHALAGDHQDGVFESGLYCEFLLVVQVVHLRHTTHLEMTVGYFSQFPCGVFGLLAVYFESRPFAVKIDIRVSRQERFDLELFEANVQFPKFGVDLLHR